MDGLRLVPVATGVSDFEAKLLAAQLGADGILWQTCGIVDSIYPFGGIDVLVPADQLDDARRVLVAIAETSSVEVQPAPDPSGTDPRSWPIAADGARRSRWIAIAAALAVLATAMVRSLAVG